MKELVFGIWLGIQGYFDFKYKEIPLWLSLFGGGLGIFLCIIEKRNIMDVLLACIPGVILLIFSWLTKEVIGYGDGIVFLIMGTYMSLSQICAIGMSAFSIAGIFALILIVIFHKKGKDQIPFIPFLVLAYGMEYLADIGGTL